MATWGSRNNRPAVCMYSQVTIRRLTSKSCGQPSLRDGVLRSLSLGMMTLSRLSLTFLKSEIESIVLASLTDWTLVCTGGRWSFTSVLTAKFKRLSLQSSLLNPFKLRESIIKTPASRKTFKRSVRFETPFLSAVNVRQNDVLSMRSDLHFEPEISATWQFQNGQFADSARLIWFRPVLTDYSVLLRQIQNEL